MSVLPKRTRKDDCLTDLRLDAWLSEELAPDGSAAATEHLARCARCRERYAALRDARDAFQRTHADGFVVRRGGLSQKPARVSRLPWRASGVVATLAAAAAVMLFVNRTVPSATLRTKGGASNAVQLEFHVLEPGGKVRRGAKGSTLHPGDRVRFSVGNETDGYLALFSLDGAGRASVYYPNQKTFAAQPAGPVKPLNTSVELDEVLGEERVFALLCDTPRALEPLRRVLATRGLDFRAPKACASTVIRWTKVSR